MLATHIIFPMKYSKWVVIIVPIRKKNRDIRLSVEFHALNKEIMKDNFPLPNMELILQQVVGSPLMSLLDGFSCYNQIILNRAYRYKSTFTT
jgi:hypothetical protein